MKRRAETEERQYAVRKRSGAANTVETSRDDDTFWVRKHEKWLPRENGSPPGGSAMKLSSAELLAEAARENGHTVDVLPLW